MVTVVTAASRRRLLDSRSSYTPIVKLKKRTGYRAYLPNRTARSERLAARSAKGPPETCETRAIAAPRTTPARYLIQIFMVSRIPYGT